MEESNQEGYQELGWIINKSEEGIFLVIASEGMQKEIISTYRHGLVQIYDYKKNPVPYSFNSLSAWVNNFKETKVFIIANFQFAVQEEEALKRLDFSRDMIENLGKNFIFLTTPYGDNMLATRAYNFYSFIKLRIIFNSYNSYNNYNNDYNYNIKTAKAEETTSVKEILEEEKEQEPGKLKEILSEASNLIE